MLMVIFIYLPQLKCLIVK